MVDDRVQAFHRLYYDSGVWARTTWMGVKAFKHPADLWIYQEILFDRRPDVIIESGSCQGGTALYLAQLCELLDCGRVYSLDLCVPQDILHPRLTFLQADTGQEATWRKFDRLIQPEERVMLILDSAHHKEHVLDELRWGASLVTPGQYLIVEDGNVNGHPVAIGYGPGPQEAIAEFLQARPEFVIDRSREKFLMTFNPGGFLERKASDAR